MPVEVEDEDVEGHAVGNVLVDEGLNVGGGEGEPTRPPVAKGIPGGGRGREDGERRRR